jgi:acyl-CoA reductase-like NAD-dependent aldehyde dehydrogenase
MATTTKTFKNFIGGEWVDAASGETFETTVPATGDTLGTFPKSGPEDVDRAVEARCSPRPRATSRKRST